MKRFLQWIVKNEIWFTLPFVGIGIALTRALPVAVGVLAFFWLLRRFAVGRFSRRTALDVPALILLFMLLVSLWVTALPDLTQIWVWRILMSVGLYYSVVNWFADRRDLKIIWIGLALGLVCLSVLAFFSVDWLATKLSFIPQSLYQRFVLALPDTVHPNIMGGVLALLAGLLLGPLLFSWREWGNLTGYLSWMGLGVGLGVLALTQSRGAILGLGLAILLLASLRWRWGWLALVSGLGGGLTLIVLYPQIFLDFFTATSSLENTVAGRVEIWQRAIYMIQDFPFTGIGIGSFMQVADALYPFFTAAPGSVPHAHNLLLQVAVDFGLPGLVAWLAAFLLVCVMGWQVYRRGRQTCDSLATGLGAGLLAFQLILMVHGMVDVIGMSRPVTLVWGVWGLAAAAWNVFVATPEAEGA